MFLKREMAGSGYQSKTISVSNEVSRAIYQNHIGGEG